MSTAPAPYYADGPVTVWHGDCLDVMRQMPDASVDAVVTDPPYGIGFMGREWDAFGGPAGITDPAIRAAQQAKWGTKFGASARPAAPAAGEMHAFQAWCEDWAREAYRLLKPGGHLLAFGGTRTFHRLAAGIEDAGFEIRDSLAWLYAQGFAKSWNFSTQYPGPWCECRGEAVPSNHAGNTDLHRLREDLPSAPVARGTDRGTDLLTGLQRSEPRPGLGEARAQGPGRLGDRPGELAGDDARQLEPVLAGRLVHRAGEGLPDDPDARPSAGTGERLRRGTPPRDGDDPRAAGDASGGGASHQPRPGGQPAGEPAPVPGSHGALDDGALRDGPICPRCGGLDQAYKGAGSALKPAFEPIVVARKPLVGTIAQNVARYGTGALNIDGSRIAGDVPQVTQGVSRNPSSYSIHEVPRQSQPHDAGRWPANVVLDASQAAALDQQSGVSTSVQGATRSAARGATQGASNGGTQGGYNLAGGAERQQFGDMGGASRFFYTAKASTDERPSVDGIAHPTVKPVDLMRWLVKLVTPPGGVVLEPFAGSGTTVEAAVLEGFHCIAIEREADYLPLILRRIRKPHAVGLDLGDWDQAPTPAPTRLRPAHGRTAPLRGTPAAPVGFDFGDDWELDA